VVPAAGNGTRFGAKAPKQYAPLLGKTVLEYTLAALCAHPEIVGVMLALAPNAAKPAQVVNGKPICSCVGGASRAESVLNALNMLREMGVHPNTLVAVHDAARPCLTQLDLTAVLRAAAQSPDGALLALPATDTIKQSGGAPGAAFVRTTLDRAAVWLAQTPQVFALGQLTAALSNTPTASDEAMAMEYAGFAPKLVPGRASNVKITHAADLALAAFYLTEQRK
jgi:2-C-methyl-D-erythritol 4-phosphate cytidylyltransferase